MKHFANYLFLIVFIPFAFIACNNPDDKGNQHLTDTDAAWRMGIALYSFHKDSFVDAIEKAESAGVKYVEGFSFHKLGAGFGLHSMADMSQKEIDKMKQMLEEKGMELKSMYVGSADNEEEWKYYFNIAREFGMEFLVSEPPTDQLDMLDSLANIYKVKIAIHEHAKGQSIYWHPDSMLVAMDGRPNIGVCADLGHWVRSGLDPVECLKKLENYLLGIHLKDVEEFDKIDAGFVTAGTGVIDFSAIISELKRQNFTGIINVECEHHTDDNLKYVIQDIRTFNELTARSR